MNINFSVIVLASVTALSACSNSEKSDNGDKSAPVFLNVTFSPSLVSGEVAGLDEIQWTTQDDNPARMQISLLQNSQLVKSFESVNNSSNKGSYIWDSRLFPDSVGYQIRLTATDIPNNQSFYSSNTFRIYNASSGGGSTLNLDLTIDNKIRSTGAAFVSGVSKIQWNGTAMVGASLLLEVSDNGGATWSPLYSNLSLASNTGSYIWDTSAKNGSDYRLRATAINGNDSISKVLQFNIDNSGPDVIESRLNYSATSADNLTITWQTAADAFGGHITYSIFRSTSAPITTLSDVATLTPVTQLIDQTQYSTNNLPSIHTDFWNIVAEDESGNKSIFQSSKPNGILDYSFSPTGYIEFDGSTSGNPIQDYWASDIANDSQSRVVIVGGQGFEKEFAIWRFTADGILDSSFNINGYKSYAPTASTTASARAVALDASDNLIVCGNYAGNSSSTQIAIIRITTTGANGFEQFPTFEGGPDSCTSIVVDNSANIFVAGWHTHAITQRKELLLQKYSSDGIPDNVFNNAVLSALSNITAESVAYDIGLDSSGNILLTGYSAPVSDNIKRLSLWKFSSSGNFVSGFGSGGIVTTAYSTATNSKQDVGYSLAISGNQAFVSGTFMAPPILVNTADISNGFVAKFNLISGANISSFGNNGVIRFPADGYYDNFASAMTLDAKNNLLIAGYVLNFDSGALNFPRQFHRVARIDSNSNLDPSFAVNGFFSLSSLYALKYTALDFPGPHLAAKDSAIYVTGRSNSATALNRMLLFKLRN